MKTETVKQWGIKGFYERAVLGREVSVKQRTGLRIRIALMLLFAMTLATASHQAAGQESTNTRPVVQTDVGALRGVVDGDVVRFRGVPFAEPPVGERRWQAPQPVQAWDGVRDASASGSACAQPAGQLPEQVLEEDCLYLDVTAPATPGTERPVMVWMHGGSLATGTGAQYDARDLVVKGDVVVVTINYRLGALGFLALPGMEGPAGAFGLADQQEALRFVQRNAAVFGGDPSNVTLFGESGGAVTTCAQLTAPGSRGLFQRAILQSAVGACGDPIEPGAVGTRQPRISNFLPRKGVEQVSLDVAGRLSCTDGSTVLACLRQVPTEALLREGSNLILPAYGGPDAVLPTSPTAAIRAGVFADVPVMAGFTSDEPSYLLAQEMLAGRKPITPAEYKALAQHDFGDRADEVLLEYPLSDYRDANQAWVKLHNASAWACPALALNDDLAARTDVYAYEFADATSPAPFAFPPSVEKGATHGAELAYLFIITAFLNDTTASALPELNEAQQRLSDRLIEVWTTFARTGDPGTPQWGSSDRRGVTYGGDEPTGDLWGQNRCDFWIGR